MIKVLIADDHDVVVSEFKVIPGELDEGLKPQELAEVIYTIITEHFDTEVVK